MSEVEDLQNRINNLLNGDTSIGGKFLDLEAARQVCALASDLITEIRQLKADIPTEDLAGLVKDFADLLKPFVPVLDDLIDYSIDKSADRVQRLVQKGLSEEAALTIVTGANNSTNLMLKNNLKAIQGALEKKR